MLTICAVKSEGDARIIKSITNGVYPEGSFEWAETIGGAAEIIRATRPDIVWIEASEESIAIASELHLASSHINFIFIAKDASFAVEAFNAKASGYILEPVTGQTVLYELDNLRYPVTQESESKLLRVQCFGNFEAFAGGRIVRFSRSLSKEALAYLVDRKGAGCTVGDICSILWEDRPVDTSLKSQCRVILGSLKKDLEKAGAGDVLVKNRNYWAIDAEKISCDYYDYLRQRAGTGAFRGEYMSQYSWAEMTTGKLKFE